MPRAWRTYSRIRHWCAPTECKWSKHLYVFSNSKDDLVDAIRCQCKAKVALHHYLVIGDPWYLLKEENFSGGGRSHINIKQWLPIKSYIYIYIYVCVCVCVCRFSVTCLKTVSSGLRNAHCEDRNFCYIVIGPAVFAHKMILPSRCVSHILYFTPLLNPRTPYPYPFLSGRVLVFYLGPHGSFPGDPFTIIA